MGDRRVFRTIRFSIIVLASLLLILVIVLFLFDASELVAPISTFAIALLTLGYVMTTSDQLKTMENQLEDMRKGRLLTEQPLPLTYPKKIIFEKPRVFHGGRKWGTHALCRYFVYCVVDNIGNSTAVNNHISTCLSTRLIKLNPIPEYLAVVGEKSKLNRKEPKKISFMFCEDKESVIIDSLIPGRTKEIPMLSICTLYKNILGGSFLCSQNYYIYKTKNEQVEILKNWKTEISSFKNQFKTDLEKQSHYINIKNNKVEDKIIGEIQKKFSSKIIGDNMELLAIQIPGSFTVRTISEEEYIETVESTRYSQKMPLLDS